MSDTSPPAPSGRERTGRSVEDQQPVPEPDAQGESGQEQSGPPRSGQRRRRGSRGGRGRNRSGSGGGNAGNNSADATPKTAEASKPKIGDTRPAPPPPRQPPSTAKSDNKAGE